MKLFIFIIFSLSLFAILIADDTSIFASNNVQSLEATSNSFYDNSSGLLVYQDNNSNIFFKSEKNIIINEQNFEGKKPANFSENYLREETLYLKAYGYILGDIKTIAELSDIENTNSEKMIKRKLQLSNNYFSFYLGEYLGLYQDNGLILTGKTLDGISLDVSKNNYAMQILYANAKGQQIEKKRVYGNNTQGPYYFENSAVIVDSEVIKIDGIILKKGIDYEIDYLQGSFNFLNRIADDKTVIEYAYEYHPQDKFNSELLGLTFKKGFWQNSFISLAYLNFSNNKGEYDNNNLLGMKLKIDKDKHNLELELARSNTKKEGSAYKNSYKFIDNSFQLQAKNEYTDKDFKSVGEFPIEQDYFYNMLNLAFMPSKGIRMDGYLDEQSISTENFHRLGFSVFCSSCYLSEVYFFKKEEQQFVNFQNYENYHNIFKIRQMFKNLASSLQLENKKTGQISFFAMNNDTTKTKSEIINLNTETIGIDNFKANISLLKKDETNKLGVLNSFDIYKLDLFFMPNEKFKINSLFDLGRASTKNFDYEILKLGAFWQEKFLNSNLQITKETNQKIISNQYFKTASNIADLNINFVPFPNISLFIKPYLNELLIRDKEILIKKNNRFNSQFSWHIFNNLLLNANYNNQFLMEKDLSLYPGEIRELHQSKEEQEQVYIKYQFNDNLDFGLAWKFFFENEENITNLLDGSNAKRSYWQSQTDFKLEYRLSNETRLANAISFTNLKQNVLGAVTQSINTAPDYIFSDQIAKYQTLSLKSTLYQQFSDNFSFNLNLGYEARNNLILREQTKSTLMGFGINYQIKEDFFVNCQYESNSDFGNIENKFNVFNIGIKYSPEKFWLISIDYKLKENQNPFYRTNELNAMFSFKI